MKIVNRKKPGALVPGFFGLPKAIANFFGPHYSSCSIRNFGTTMENPYERLPIPTNDQKAAKPFAQLSYSDIFRHYKNSVSA